MRKRGLYVALTSLGTCLGVGMITPWLGENPVFKAEAAEATEAGRAKPLGFRRLQLSDEFFSEGASIGDIDGDGESDVVSGPYWHRGPEFKERKEIYPPKPFNPKGYSDNFFSYTYDFNRDDRLDVLVLSFPGKEAFWFENPGPAVDEHWVRHVVLDMVDNESPTFADLTGDGVPEIVCSQGGRFGFAEINVESPESPWIFRPISPEKVAGGRFTHGLGVGDVSGDGRPDLLEKSSWWEQPESLEGDPEWKRHRVTLSGPGGAQMYAYDFDGDGDQDILTSLAAHAWGLAWYEQVVDPDSGRRSFKVHKIMGEKPEENPYGVAFSQLHAIGLADMDGDGIRDIVTGKRWWAHNGKDPGGDQEAVLYWFRTVRSGEGVDFVPHLIDTDSGVGTDVTVGDVNGDGRPDIVVGNKKGTFVHLQDPEAEPTPAVARPLAAPKRTDFVEGGQTAEAAREGFTLYEGFEIDLIAAEPDIRQPIAITFDARGRLWAAEAHTYPTRAPEGEGRDRILIFEDTNGNGRYDKRTVFCEGLNLVSGLEVGFGGVWVGAAPYLLFIPDRDGDDQPDAEPEVLLDGWGYQDTHETLNAFRWGPDGWLYGCHGVFTHSKVGAPGTPEDERIPINAGVWRFHPEHRDFEVFAWGTSNPWGVDFNDHGQAFITACVIPHLYHVIQGARYQRQGGRHFNPYVYDDIKTIADHVHYVGSIRDHAHWGKRPDAPTDTLQAGGGHAHCGLAIYLGDNFPDSFRNVLLFNNLHGHGMNQERLERSGSGYIGRHAPDFLYANDRWHMGISTRVGPDGALYLCDWYDEQVCHRRDPEIWDRSNGRLYRIRYGDLENRDVDLTGSSDLELVALQGHRNEWHVRTARRMLQERSLAGALDREAVEGALRERFEKERHEPQQLRELWALHAVGALGERDWLTLSEHPHPYVRAWSIQLAGERGKLTDPVRSRYEAMAREDVSPVVRLYLAALSQRLPQGERWSILEGLAARDEDAEDHNLPLMVWYGLEGLVPEDAERALSLGLGSKLPRLGAFVLRRLSEEAKGREALLTRAASAEVEAAFAQSVLRSIGAALQDRTSAEMPAAWNAFHSRWADAADTSMRRDLRSLGIKFGDRRLLPELRRILADGKAAIPARQAALASLLAAGDRESIGLFHELLSPDTPGKLRLGIIQALSQLQNESTPGVLLGHYDTLSAPEKAAVITALSSDRAAALQLLEAVGEGLVPRGDLSAFAARQLRAMKQPEVDAALARHWGSIQESSAEKQAELARYRELLTPKALGKADLGNGRRLYNQTCFACHTLFGEGQHVGPDITGSNRGNLEYLLENILDPSALIGQDYQLHVFSMKDGRVLSGMVRQENDQAITIALAGGAEFVLPRSEIAERQQVPVSMMPEGILAPFSDNDVRDLIAYLQAPNQVRLSRPGEIFLEGEALKVVAASGKARPQSMTHFKASRWEGDKHLWWTGAKPGERLELAFSVPEEGRYRLYANFTKARDYGRVKLWLDEGAKLVEELDLFHASDVTATGEMDLGIHELSAGEHRLVTSVTGAHPQAVKAYMFGLDYLRLVPES